LKIKNKKYLIPSKKNFEIFGDKESAQLSKARKKFALDSRAKSA